MADSLPGQQDDPNTEALKVSKELKEFLEVEGFAYIELLIAIRSGNWTLRLSALKNMVPSFHAFDWQNYAKLILIH